MVTWLATPSSAARFSMKARSSASTPPVSANTVCTFQPRSCSQGTQKLVSSPPENARTMSRLSAASGLWDWGFGEAGCWDMGESLEVGLKAWEGSRSEEHTSELQSREK